MGQRLLGIDYGLARIGVAVCDELGISTRPIGFIPRESDEQAAALVARLARQERAAGIVIGKPLHAHGDEGENVRWVRAFAAKLAAACDLPQFEADERHSSQEAEAALRAEGKWPATPGQVDAKAAAIILRRYLDGLG
jgi:putative Holliday junction resolvase